MSGDPYLLAGTDTLRNKAGITEPARPMVALLDRIATRCEPPEV